MLVTDSSVVVLDGASAFAPVDVPTDRYVDKLAAAIGMNVEHADVSLDVAVAEAIRETAKELQLSAGNSPSSTVSVLRVRPDVIDLYSLGDSAIYYGSDDGPVNVMIDRRLAQLGIPEHEIYRERMAAGCGYDERHRELLARLQQKQRERRNCAGGYWIAEASPDAAYRGYLSSLPRDFLTWAVLATDGAYGPMLHLGLADWPRLAHESGPELERVLEGCARWERDEDPDGRMLPRAKVSDDKTLVAVELDGG
ncbi:PP2C family serine/threonine-protein phosphatase [Amycolatopsis australiensis]|uniref:PP2C family serine/threonine-protein phosphatase n=1 Tax=Amycolatopsis australiensis TaxID=546364 RepID=UPI0009FE56FE|nr:PP2C family serine/threonine-protein phosphatase [Amycolatopsis australiensis]